MESFILSFLFIAIPNTMFAFGLKDIFETSSAFQKHNVLIKTLALIPPFSIIAICVFMIAVLGAVVFFVIPKGIINVIKNYYKIPSKAK